MHLYVHQDDAHMIDKFKTHNPPTKHSSIVFPGYVTYHWDTQLSIDSLRSVPCFALIIQRRRKYYPMCLGSAWYRYDIEVITSGALDQLRTEWKLNTLHKKLGV